MPDLYIIGGCNGAGKTTASYTVLPEIFNCREFVNADSIAAGLSPFNAENVAIEAGRIMLNRINQLVDEGADFAFETTLSSRSYVPLIKRVQNIGYTVTLLFFWLQSPEMARQRVAKRVSKGGHNIPSDVIDRRYFRGIYNLFNLFIPICNRWVIVDNTDIQAEVIAEGTGLLDIVIKNPDIWDVINKNKDYGK